MKYIELKMKENNKKPEAEGLVGWVKRDWPVILVLLFALAACLYTYNYVGSYVNACNEHWIEQVQPIIDRCSYGELDSPVFTNYNMTIDWGEGVDLNGS